METKTFEIRDRGTFIPALAVRLNPASDRDRYLLSRAGYGPYSERQGLYVLLMRLDGGPSRYDPQDWSDRTMHFAHEHIISSFGSLESGAVIDVEFLLEETKEPKLSEQVTVPAG